MDSTSVTVLPVLALLPIAGSVASVAGLRLTAENLTGRRNRIGTVLVQRMDAGKLTGAPSASRQARAESGGNGPDGSAKAGNGVSASRKTSE